MKQNNLNQPATIREQVIFALVALIAWFFLFNFFMKPQVAALKTLQKKVADLTQEKAALVNFAEVTPVLEKTVTLSKRKGVKSRILLGDLKPISEDLTSILQYMVDPTLGPHLEFKDVTSSPKIPQKGYSVQPFKIKVKGEYHAVLQYFERLEQFPALFEVLGLDMKVAAEQPQNLDVEYGGNFYKIEPGMNPAGEPNSNKKDGNAGDKK